MIDLPMLGGGGKGAVLCCDASKLGCKPAENQSYCSVVSRAWEPKSLSKGGSEKRLENDRDQLTDAD